jgi:molecular chaperone DnaK (HSP70)
MRVSPLICPTCEAAVSEFDQYCGVCGTVLAHLRWRAPDEESWHSGDGHLAVRVGAQEALVRFRNEGVVSAMLVLRAQDIALLPDWVDRDQLKEQILISPPGSNETQLVIPLVPSRLTPLFEAPESAPLSNGQREAHLPFLTHLNELRDGRWTSRPFKLTLLAARLPWVSPACSFYPFLPVERLAGKGIEQRIELHNETIQALELAKIWISDLSSSGPSEYAPLTAETILHSELPDQRRIEPGGIWSHVLRLSIVDPSYDAVGQFFGKIEYLCESIDKRESHRLNYYAKGLVGRGPTLRVKGPSSLAVAQDRISREHSFTLENPGHIPVLIEAIEILRDQGEKEELAADRDWLSLTGLTAGDVLGPKEVRTLSVQLHPSRRPSDELEEEYCQRSIRIRHDGLPSPVEQSVGLEVSVGFGKAREFTAGIDFGTTNSVVCIGDFTQAYPLRLEANTVREPNRIRSLMYFDSNAPTSTDFRFGEEAVHSAAIRPENLVRSIKTVIARDPKTKYVFHKRTSGQGDQRVTKTPQDLLNLFIAELRARAEPGVNHLPGEVLDALDLDIGTQITLSRAVFSHPVETTEEAQRALRAAAHGAGINVSVQDVEDFFEQCCIDEATAAVLAYVAGRVQDPPILDLPPADRERVLCFDMGGGTTDLATVEVLQMASFLGDPNGITRVIVNLENKGGARFGGDDLDEMLAFMILAGVERQSEERGTPVILEDIERAIRARSYSDFKNDFYRRHALAGEQHAPAEETRAEDEALGIYKLATEILKMAEEAKCKLSASPTPELLDLPGTGWPRQGPDAQAAAVNFEIELRRDDFEKKVRKEVRKLLLSRLDSVVSGAEWDWPSVTTLLFTGQSARVPVIREEVTAHVNKRRGLKAPPLLLLEPGQERFDPKNCVAIGAAIWGSNRTAGSWLDIRTPVREHLTFDLETRIGPRFRPVRGLNKGQALPAQGVVPVQKGVDVLTLHRDGSRDPYVRFRFPPLQETDELTVRVSGPSDYTLIVNGNEVKGEVRS